MNAVVVGGAGEVETNGVYASRDPKLVPAGFARTCDDMGWDSDSMWRRLTDGKRTWWEADNEAYIYWNRADGKWWIDVPSGAGAYIVEAASAFPPEAGWQALPGIKRPLPKIEVVDVSAADGKAG